TPAATTLELFEATAHPSGYGEGTLFVPTPWALLEGGPNDTDATAGSFEFSFPAGSLAAGDWLTATATDAANNTSEFGPNRRVLDPPEPPAPVTIDGRVFEDIVGDHLLVGAVGDPDNPLTPGVTVDLFRELPQEVWSHPDLVTGTFVSGALSPTGEPRFVSRDSFDRVPNLVSCADAKCDTVTRQFAGTSPFDTGYYTDIAIASDGYPVISHYRADTGDLRIRDCNGPDCSPASDRQIDTGGDVGLYTSIGIPPSSDLPVVSYYDATNGDLKIHRCDDSDCTSGFGFITVVDSVGDVGRDTDMAIGADGLPIIAYYDVTNTALKVAHCDDTDCATATITTVDSTNDRGREPSIAIGYDGLPKITYYDASADRLRFARCDDAACTSSTQTTLTLAGVGPVSDIEMGPDGFPWIAYESGDTVYVRYCYTDSCGSSFASPIDFGGDIEGQYLDMVIPPATGTPVLGYYDITEGRFTITAITNDPRAGSTGVATDVTDGLGTFSFSGVPAGEYWVSPRSSTVTPSAGLTTSPDTYHAEQTYGPSGSFCEDGTGTWVGPTASADACYGGVEGDEDDSTTSLISYREHLALVGAPVDATVGDFGFSFNVVTRSHNGVGGFAQQGSLDQFIQNANTVVGGNTMRFVPRVPANSFGGGGSWWRLWLVSALSDINDGGTIVDGHAFNPDGTDRDTNTGTLGTGGFVGVDNIGLVPVDKPELEIRGSQLAFLDAGGLSPDGSEVHRISIHGIGDPAQDLIYADGTAPLTGLEVTSSIIGSAPGTFAPSPGAHRWGVGLNAVDGTLVTGNLIGFGERGVQLTGSASVIIQGNEIVGASKDGVDGYYDASNVTVVENLIRDSDDFGIDMLAGNSVIRNNTIDNNGNGAGQTGGIRLYEAVHLVEKNIVTNSGGPGVLVSGYDSLVV
ncbi:MAG: right-handed parallel beta-helix repeat-containing protein, partial [Acidimicrobiia bacterium]|nr:right-handed parallel beta-helix repeat-containing protein [Acidimicrobiia bacterium]